MTISRSKKLRELLGRAGSFLTVGCYDALTAKMIEKAGFETVYVSGASVSMALLGKPDLGLASYGEIFGQVQRITQVTEAPVIIDADTGYGNFMNARRAFAEYEQVGIAGIQIEDQIFPKRCGHLEGTQVVQADEMIDKIKAVLDVRRNPDTVLIARTDARQSLGLGEAIRRANLYAEAGADVIFLEGPDGREECEAVAKQVNAPLLVNTGGRGLTPKLSLSDFESIGYKIVLHPGVMQRAAVFAMRAMLADLNQNGNLTETKYGQMDFDEWFELVDLSKYKETEKRFATGARRMES
jgi:2-methylisocitrate lyase-like PEP mutase family enzyme